MTREYSVADARQHLAALIDEVQRGQAVRLTRRGQPVAVVISPAEFDRLVSGRPALAEALAMFRASGEGVEDVDEIFEVRDRSPGRRFDDL